MLRILPCACVLALFGLVACRPPLAPGSTSPGRHDAQSQPDAIPGQASPADALDPMAIYLALEGEIDVRDVGENERQRAYEAVADAVDDGSPGYALARAALAGRLAETRGLSALGLVREAEHYARTSRNRDPNFRDEEATRMLGSLQALAGDHLEEATTEDGIEVLENLLRRRPEDRRTALRLAQALVALGDPESALAPLCACAAGKDELRASERRIFELVREQLLRELDLSALDCPGPRRAVAS